MAKVQHGNANKNKNSGRGNHPQLRGTDFVDEAERLAFTQTPGDKGGHFWQNSDGTTWQADGAGGWKEMGGTSGEVNTASNVGTGAGVFKQKVGVDLRFRKVKAGSGITVNQLADEVEIVNTQTPGEVNTASNSGAGAGLAQAKSGNDLPFKSLTAGAGVTLTPSADEIEIAAAGGLVFSTGAAKVASYTALFGEIVKVDPSGGGVIITPTGSPSVNDKLGIKNVTNSTNAITFDADGGGKLVDGQLATVLLNPFECQIYQYNGTQWSRITDALVVGSGVTSVPLYDPADSPVGQWPFEGNGDDESGNALNLAAVGSTVFVTDPDPDFPLSIVDLPGSVQCWDNVSERYDGAAGASWDSLRIAGANAVTIQAWIKLDNVSGTKYLVSQGGGSASGDAENILYQLVVTGSSLRYLHQVAGGGTKIRTATGAVLTSGIWHHVAITRAADGLGIAIYVDGKLKPATGTIDVVSVGGGDGIFSIGEDNGSGVSPGTPFVGLIRGTQVRNVEVSASKIAENFLRGSRAFI